MTRWLYSLCLLLLGVPALASPQSAVAAALNDAQRLPPAIAQQTRYLSLHSVPADQRETARKVLAFHCNSLSREAELVAPRQVTPDLLAVSLLDYGWAAKTWEKLAEVEPYFHVSILVDEYQDWGYFSNGRWVTTRREKTGRKVKQTQAAAPWLDAQQVAALIALTQSQTPVVRADWFVHQTAIQADRKAGYYDFLGLGKKKADFDKLVGLDVAAAQRLRKEIAAIVPVSTVALNNRHIVRFQTLTGAYWETRDAKASTDKRNALRLLNGDFSDYDAQEIYGTLPNGLFAFFLADAKGNRTDTAPDFIASDGRASGTDRRVHVGLSCVRCHLPGIQAIDDWARRLYTGPIQLQAADPARFVRLRQLYLSDLDRHVRRDQDDYADVVKRLNGLTAAENAKAYAAFWDAYEESPVRLTDAVRELGTTEQRLRDAIAGRVAAGFADPVLAGLVQRPPLTIRRDHWEELQPIVWATLGYKP